MKDQRCGVICFWDYLQRHRLSVFLIILVLLLQLFPVGGGRDAGAVELLQGQSEISVADLSLAEGNSGITTFGFVLTRTGPTDSSAFVEVMVNSEKIGNYALGESDFSSMGSMPVFFDIGQSIAILSVTVYGDLIPEPDETFSVTIGYANGMTILDGMAVGTILNDDAGSLYLTINSLADSDDGPCQTAGSGNGCTLREAINTANTYPGENTINFAVTGTINLSGALPTIRDPLILTGPGADQLTIDGAGLYRPFITDGNISISDLTIRHAYETGNGGGAIYRAYGPLTLTRVTVADSHSTSYGGAIYTGGTFDPLTLIDCTLSGNTAGMGGAALTGFGTTTITNTTISGNSAPEGGALNLWGGYPITITNSTITNNSGTNGGAIYSTMTYAPLNIVNSIVAGNTAPSGPNISGPFVDQSHNVIDTDPLLGVLQDNGGPTLTHLPLPGSPAIDAGDPAACPANDQRGEPRPLDGDDNGSAICDSGSVEAPVPTDFCDSVTEIPVSECEALVALYNSANGPNWADKTGWVQTTTPCSWYGMTCESGHVASLNLRNNQLDGPLPAALNQLSALEVLMLEGNSLNGSIPATLGNLSSLEHLGLANNQLVGSIPPELGNLTMVGTFHLESNLLTGSIPAELANLPLLRYLDLTHNQLTGPIPAQLGSRPSLNMLLLSDNQLSGPIPPELANLTGLDWLLLTNNRLTGPIPAGIGNITGLYCLGLGNNALSGEVPASLVPLNLTCAFNDFSYNKLIASDLAVRNWLISRDGDWEQTQTIPPTNIAAGTITANSVDITWTPILYTGDGGGYEVGYATTASGPYTVGCTIANKTATGCTVSGLIGNTPYYFAVRTHTPAHGAQQNDLWSGYSQEITATTLWDTPPVETRLTLIDLDGMPGIQVNENFDVKVECADVRLAPIEQSVFSCYMDLNFPPALMQVIQPDGIVYNLDFFPNLRTGTVNNTTGEVDEVGATDGFGPTSFLHVFTLHMRALATGSGSIVSSVGEASSSEITVFFDDNDQRNHTQFGSLPLTIVQGYPDLVGTVFKANPDHVLKGQTNVTVTVKNQGTAAASAFSVQVYYSDDATISSAADTLVQTLWFDALPAGQTQTQAVSITLPVSVLNTRALADDPPGLGAGRVSTSADHIGIVIDPANSVEELDETNNLNQGKALDKDDVTYFPWDIDNSGAVTPTDALFVINRLGQTVPPADARADFDGINGITPTDALSGINRLGYQINTSVIEAEASPGMPAGVSTSSLAELTGIGDTVELSMRVVELDSTPGITVGETFDVVVDFTDIRTPGTPQSVFSAYADIVFDPAVLRVDSLSYPTGFANMRTGTINNVGGIVDEVGATDGLGPIADRQVFTLHLTALAAAPTNITTNAGESGFSQITVFGDDTDQRTKTVYGSLNLGIGAAPVTAPSNLTAAGVSTTQIDLTWVDNAADETNFRIERSADGLTGWAEIGSAGPNLTAFSDVTLGCDTIRFYRVRAYRSSDGQYSAYTEIEDATTWDCPPTAAPLLIAPPDQSTTTHNQPAFTWAAVEHAHTYQIQLATSPDFATPVQDVVVNDLDYLPESLNDQMTYFWRVRGIGQHGELAPWSLDWRVTIDTTYPAAPRLSAPKDFTNTTDTTPTLSWSKVPGAAHYYVQVDDFPYFDSPVWVDVALTNSYTIPNLNALPYGMYYWRVAAVTGDDVWSDWSQIWRFNVTLLKSPVNASFVTDTTPTFTWTAVPGALEYWFTLYEDAWDPMNWLINVSTGTATSFTPASPLDEGEYFWTVRVVYPGGASSLWMLHWSLTVTMPPTAKPLLLTPPNGAILDDTTPAFTWDEVSGGDVYQIQIDETGSFSSPLQDVTLDEHLLTYTAAELLDGGKFFWRVRAINGEGVAGAWGGPFNFTLAQLAAPVLWTPKNGSTTSDTTPAFAWSSVLNATSYQIQISRDATFVTITHQGSPAGMSYTVPDVNALPDGVTYWRVRAVNSAGVAGKWSAKWKLTLDTSGPAAPVLSSPAPNSGTLDTTPTFKWKAPTGGKTYTLQVTRENDPDFAAPFIDTPVPTPYFTPLTALDFGGYLWRVRAFDALGNQGVFSPARHFTVTLHKSPADGSASTNLQPTFIWNALLGATSYEFELDNNPDFLSLEGQYSGPNKSFKPDVPLAPGTYYWHVKANTGDWMPAWTVILTPPLPAKTALLAPPHKTLTNDNTPTFEWKAVSGSVTYQIQIDNNNDFSSPTQDVVVGGLLNYIASELPDGIAYWRVRALNTFNAPGAWSSTWSLTIDTLPPAVPVLIAPVDGGSMTNAKFALTWNKVSDAVRYEVKLDVAGQTVTPLFDAGNKTSFKPAIPLARGHYDWRVRAIDKAGNASDWSLMRRFEIVAGVTSVDPTPVPTDVPINPTPEPTLVPTLEPTPAPTDTPVIARLPFAESFDSGQGWIVGGAWLVDTRLAHSGAGWWADSTVRGLISTLTFSGRIDLTSAQNPQLGFWQRGSLSANDVLSVEVSLDGGLMWWPAQRQSALSTDWTWQTVDLSAYRGSVIALRFVLTALDPLAPGAVSVGFGLDDLLIQDVPLTPTPVPTLQPTVIPTEIPPDVPTLEPTVIPTEIPTEVPTLEPTVIPTDVPTEIPTEIPTEAPPDVPPERQTGA